MFLIWSNNSKIKTLKIDHFSGVLVMTMKLEYIFAPFVLHFVR